VCGSFAKLLPRGHLVCLIFSIAELYLPSRSASPPFCSPQLWNVILKPVMYTASE